MTIHESPTPVSGTGVVHGEVLTRPWIANLILDLAGYTADKPLARETITEPSAGTGAFLEAIVDRLIESVKHYDVPWSAPTLDTAIRAVEIQPGNIPVLLEITEGRLCAAGCPDERARELTDLWVVHDDYVTAHEARIPSDYVIGNPPYIRRDDLGAESWDRYAAIAETMTARGDLYLAFWELGLRQLKSNGIMGLICADRWQLNDYGKALRKFITREGYAIAANIRCHNVDAFTVKVNAYPAITLLRNGPQGPALIADTDETFGPESAPALVGFAATGHDDRLADTGNAPGIVMAWLPHWHAEGADPWPHGTPAVLAWLDGLTALPTIEEAGGLIRIGVATGADQVYVVGPENIPSIEPDRLLPLAMRADIRTGTWEWTGHYLVDPWDEQDKPIRIEEYPLTRGYLESRLNEVKGRNVAQRHPDSWWRTIDKVTHERVNHRLIYLPDIAETIDPVVGEPGYYPHHNLYFIDPGTSGWDAEALAGYLMSAQAHRMVAAHCVLMRGNSLRLQAQYLRRIRIPRATSVGVRAMEGLRKAYASRDRDAATRHASIALKDHPLPE